MWTLFGISVFKNPQKIKTKIHSIYETIGNLNSDRTFDTSKSFFKKVWWLYCGYVLKTYLLKKHTHIFLKRFLKFIYERPRKRGRDTGRGGEAGSMQRAWCGIWSRVSGITPGAKGRHTQPLSHPGIPAYSKF